MIVSLSCRTAMIGYYSTSSTFQDLQVLDEFFLAGL